MTRSQSTTHGNGSSIAKEMGEELPNGRKVGQWRVTEGRYVPLGLRCIMKDWFELDPFDPFVSAPVVRDGIHDLPEEKSLIFWPGSLPAAAPGSRRWAGQAESARTDGAPVELAAAATDLVFDAHFLTVRSARSALCMLRRRAFGARVAAPSWLRRRCARQGLDGVLFGAGRGGEARARVVKGSRFSASRRRWSRARVEELRGWPCKPTARWRAPGCLPSRRQPGARLVQVALAMGVHADHTQSGGFTLGTRARRDSNGQSAGRFGWSAVARRRRSDSRRRRVSANEFAQVRARLAVGAGLPTMVDRPDELGRLC